MLEAGGDGLISGGGGLGKVGDSTTYTPGSLVLHTIAIYYALATILVSGRGSADMRRHI